MPPFVVVLYVAGILFSFFNVQSFTVVSLLFKVNITGSLNFYSHFFIFFQGATTV